MNNNPYEQQPLNSPQPPTSWPPPPSGGYGYPPVSPLMSPRFRRVTTLAVWSAVLIGVNVFCNTAFSIAKSTGASDLEVVFSILTVLTLIAACIVFLCWVYRIYSNLSALGARNLLTSPGWAAAYYLIPILSLYKPYQIMDEVWKASGPNPVPQRWPQPGYQGDSPRILGWWWLFWIVWNIVGRIEAQYASDMGPEGNVAFRLITAGLGIITGVLAVRVVWLFTRRQEEAARRLAG